MSATTARIARARSHRPWPIPDRPWIMFQSWRRLLFIHWPVPREELRPLVPTDLTLEEHGGSAWIGLVPFYLTGLRLRWLPPLPGLSSFPEMNLRTYVRVGDRPGIFFFTLEAESRPAVWGARAAYRLPYHYAEMDVSRSEGSIRYRSRRPDGSARFEAHYRPTGPASRPDPGTLEHFLTERYALYTVPERGTILRGDIHHPPWTLQPAEAEIQVNTVPAVHGISLPDAKPLLHYSKVQDALVWTPEAVS